MFILCSTIAFQTLNFIGAQSSQGPTERKIVCAYTSSYVKTISYTICFGSKKICSDHCSLCLKRHVSEKYGYEIDFYCSKMSIQLSILIM